VGKAAHFVRLPLTFDKHYASPEQALLDKGHLLKVCRGKASIICTREAPPLLFKEPGRLLGVDANTKHNLLATSDHRAYDYNRLWLDLLLVQLLKLDAKGSTALNFRDKGRLAKLMRANESALKRLLHDVLAQFEADGVTDLVLEDLSGFKGTMLSRHPEFEQKYTRLLRLLRLSSLKDWLSSQAEKRGIRVHLTHAAYSSQECPQCHHVSKGNRVTQEIFSCEACGHTAPADFVSGENLAHRMTSDVLRTALHTFDKFGRASPLPMSRAALKSLLTG
jgi:putative transposase